MITNINNCFTQIKTLHFIATRECFSINVYNRFWECERFNTSCVTCKIYKVSCKICNSSACLVCVCIKTSNNVCILKSTCSNVCTSLFPNIVNKWFIFKWKRCHIDFRTSINTCKQEIRNSCNTWFNNNINTSWIWTSTAESKVFASKISNFNCIDVNINKIYKSIECVIVNKCNIFRNQKFSDVLIVRNSIWCNFSQIIKFAVFIPFCRHVNFVCHWWVNTWKNEVCQTINCGVCECIFINFKSLDCVVKVCVSTRNVNQAKLCWRTCEHYIIKSIAFFKTVCKSVSANWNNTFMESKEFKWWAIFKHACRNGCNVCLSWNCQAQNEISQTSAIFESRFTNCLNTVWKFNKDKTSAVCKCRTSDSFKNWIFSKIKVCDSNTACKSRISNWFNCFWNFNNTCEVFAVSKYKVANCSHAATKNKFV